MRISNELTEKDFLQYLKHLESIGCIILNWSYILPDRSWSVEYKFIPPETPEWIQIDLNL